MKKTTMTETPKPTIESLGLDLKCIFVPLGVRKMQPEDKSPMLGWSVLFANKRGEAAFDYFTGLGLVDWRFAEIRKGACPLHSKTHNAHGWTLDQWQVLNAGARRWEMKDQTLVASVALKIAYQTKFLPDPVEILHALATDATALDTSFEGWCSDFGYDTH